MSEYQNISSLIMKGACVKRVFDMIKVNKTCNESIQNTSKHAYYPSTKHIICYMVSILCFVSTGTFVTQPTLWLADMLELALD